jgi:DUF1680 family protein
MLQFEGDGRYADVMERALYNGTISGVSLGGERFFYVNPLESAGHHHRQDWFGCACCPPNLARMVASLGQYVYSTCDGEEGGGCPGVQVHLYVQGEAHVTVGGQPVVITQETRYPWEGLVRITVKPATPARLALSLRLPGWCSEALLTVDGETVDIPANSAAGYVRVEREWSGTEAVELRLAMPVVQVAAHPAVRADEGLVALQRGPVVYCLEAADNVTPLGRVVVPAAAEFSAEMRPELLGGVAVLTGEALAEEDAPWEGTLYRPATAQLRPCRTTAIPYCVWENRTAGEMRVWLRKGGP